jgi:pimeloyl-ACP methyl ester carboxylesterase
MQTTVSSESPPNITERHRKILGWPTDILSVDYLHHDDDTIETPHTILIFIPGNPGQYDWYLSDLCTLVQRLGHGYAARAVSHAGHSLRRGGQVSNDEEDGIVNVMEYVKQNPNAEPAIPWTILGQVQHKAAFLDDVMAEFAASSSSLPQLIFMGHSFGCHVIQQLCLLLRPKIFDRTLGFLYLMPFIRMKANYFHQCKLDWGAQHPNVLITLGTIMSHGYKLLPKDWVDALFKFRKNIHHDNARDIAVRLIRQPTFVRNFFTLGTEEIRNIPKNIDVSGKKKRKKDGKQYKK